MNNEMNNAKLKTIAEKVVSKVAETNDSPEKFGSVVIILMVVSIILTLIRVWQECHKSKLKGLNKSEQSVYANQEIKTLSIRKSWYTKMVVKKAIRKELSKEDYKDYGISLMNSILDTAANLNQNEIQTLMEVANV